MSFEPRLRVADLHKRFGAVRALDGVDLQVDVGQVHALLGHNGSGKSTLVKVLTGYHTADSGSAEINGVEVESAGQQLPLAVVHQELALIDSGTVLENFGVAVGYGAHALGRVAWRRQAREVNEILAKFGAPFGAEAELRDLTPGEQAMVAIVRAFRVFESWSQPGLLVMDEPTAYLGGSESDKVLNLIRAVAAAGAGVLFISHRLAEVRKVADWVTVLRDGRVVATQDAADLSETRIASAMFGEVPARRRKSTPRVTSHAPLVVSQLHGRRIRNASLTINSGEVVGVAGLAGMGQSELAKMLGGASPKLGGSVHLGNVDLSNAGPRKTIDAGLAYVPGERRQAGLWIDASATDNLSLPHLADYYKSGKLRKRSEMMDARILMRSGDVRPPEPALALNSFSGGNQQKIVLAKWLALKPQYLILDDPFQGVDISARAALLEMIAERSATGMGALFVSSDYDELAEVCDRVFIVYEGRLVREITGAELSSAVLFAATQSGEPIGVEKEA